MGSRPHISPYIHSGPVSDCVREHCIFPLICFLLWYTIKQNTNGFSAISQGDFTRQSAGPIFHRECTIETEKEKMNEGHIKG